MHIVGEIYRLLPSDILYGYSSYYNSRCIYLFDLMGPNSKNLLYSVRRADNENMDNWS